MKILNGFLINLIKIVRMEPLMGMQAHMASLIPTASMVAGKDPRCDPSPNTKILNITFYSDKLALSAMKSLNNDTSSGSSNELNENISALKSYIGSIVDNLNADVFRFGIQFNLQINSNSVNQFSSYGYSDQSCEKGDTLEDRTDIVHSNKVSQNDNELGINIYIFSCIYHKPNASKLYIVKKGLCGRTIGIMWNGSVLTENLIKSAIIEALSGFKDTYSTNQMILIDQAPICKFTESCIGQTPSAYGEIFNSITYLKSLKANNDIGDNNFVNSLMNN